MINEATTTASCSRFLPKRLINVFAIRYEPPASETKRPIIAPNPKTMANSPSELPIPSLMVSAISAGFIPSPSATKMEVTIRETNVFNLTLIIKKSSSRIPNNNTTNYNNTTNCILFYLLTFENLKKHKDWYMKFTYILQAFFDKVPGSHFQMYKKKNFV